MKIEVSNATVQRVFHDGRGVVVFEQYEKRDGSPGRSFVTCWFDQAPGLAEGDVVSVSGRPSAKVSSYTNREGVEVVTADLQVNAAHLLDVNGSSGVGAASNGANGGLSDEPWTNTRSQVSTSQTADFPNASSSGWDETVAPF